MRWVRVHLGICVAALQAAPAGWSLPTGIGMTVTDELCLVVGPAELTTPPAAN